MEYRAVREHLDGSLVEREERGTLYEVGTFFGELDTWKVVLVETGAGNTSAGVELERAISLFAPEVVFFVGVAGGRKDVELGDVVVANWVYDYESGKDTEHGYIPRTRSYASAHRLVQRSNAIVRQGAWARRIRGGADSTPAAIVKPVVAGAKVIAHKGSQVAELLDRYCDDAVAVEMEGHGFLYCAYVNSGVDALIVRGISDLLTGKNVADDRHWQPKAAEHAAAFVFELLNQLRGTDIGTATVRLPRRRAPAADRGRWSTAAVRVAVIIAVVALLAPASAPIPGASAAHGIEWAASTVEFAHPTVLDTDHHGVWGLAEIVYSPDGRFVVTSGNEAHESTTRIWDVGRKEEVAVLPDAGIPTAFSPDGRILVTGTYDYEIRFWDMATFRSLGTLDTDGLTTLVFRPGTGMVVSGTGTGYLQEWNSVTPSLRRLVRAPGAIEAIAVNRGGMLVAVCVQVVDGDSHVVVWNGTTTKAIDRFDHLHRPVALSADATLLIGGAAPDSVGIPRELEFWNLTRRQRLDTLSLDSPAATYVSPVISQDGDLVAVPENQRVHLLRVTDTGVEPVARLTGFADGEVTSLAFSPDGRTLAAGDDQGRLRFWDFSDLPV
ncbi:hypothetical protein GCM10027436_20100 [Actinophytocola sediminis]